jgi:RNA polymerase sigma factor (sigma-70 family)
LFLKSARSRRERKDTVLMDPSALVHPTAAEPDSAASDPETPDATPAAEVTVDLLARAKVGERDALEALMARSLPPLRRWAHGRLPAFARGALDTCDVVQDAVSRALRKLDGFESRHQGALQAYLRQAVMNRIRDVIRARRRRPDHVEAPDELLAEETSPLDRLIGAEQLAQYDEALLRLRPIDREAIVGRLELHYSYQELAVLLDKPSPDAARVAVTRALARLVDEIRSTAAIKSPK